jgi:hypothetical protein
MPPPNAVMTLRIKALICENCVCIDPIVSSLECKQLATQAGFLTHPASQSLAVVLKLFHDSYFPSAAAFRKTASNQI